MAGVQRGFHDGLAKTPFIAEVDRGLCDYCGECLRSCNVKCIGLASQARAPRRVTGAKPRKRYAEVDTRVCLGCGVCIPGCERGAISLVKRLRYRKPPLNQVSLFARILWEKGRLMPFLVEALKRRWRLPPMRRR